MEICIYNSLEFRLETIDIEFTKENTTWFDDYEDNDDIYMITDFKGCILITKCGHDYPVLIDGSSRAEIGNDKGKVRELERMMEY